MKSKLPNVWEFQNWIYTTIETMRRYGIAFSEQRANEMQTIATIVPEYMKPIIDDMKNDIENYKTAISELQEKAKYYDECINNKSVSTSSQIAKDFGMSATQLHMLLHSYHIVYQVNKDYVLYDEYANLGLTLTQNKNGYNVITGWTEKGREFLHNVLIENGYKLNINK